MFAQIDFISFLNANMNLILTFSICWLFYVAYKKLKLIKSNDIIFGFISKIIITLIVFYLSHSWFGFNDIRLLKLIICLDINMLSLYLSFNKDKYINFAFILSLFSFTLTSIFLISYFYNLNLLNYILLLFSVLSLEFAYLDIPSGINTINSIKKPSFLNSFMENNDSDNNSDRSSSRNSDRSSHSNDQPESKPDLSDPAIFAQYIRDRYPNFANILKNNCLPIYTYRYYYEKIEFEMEYFKRGLVTIGIPKDRYLSVLTNLLDQAEGFLGPKTIFLKDIRDILTVMGNDDTKDALTIQRAIYLNSLQTFWDASPHVESHWRDAIDAYFADIEKIPYYQWSIGNIPNSTWELIREGALELDRKAALEKIKQSNIDKSPILNEIKRLSIDKSPILNEIKRLSLGNSSVLNESNDLKKESSPLLNESNDLKRESSPLLNEINKKIRKE
jgi:hypothetical protein